ncbi:TSC22 domain family protein 1 isoform X1 [Nothobranchius furzeri]|uniref:TSC22 domain family protein 1 n=1 Tax=Nothobranchius furzeri TaxID=105023 RepID=A0A1A8B117_NOTFU|nr:TSC22 domain family protein 1 isoform X1 [Nothobranchius furzeri]KAF7230171.1 transcript variant X1 [Nothobranchius furzeri]
MHHQDVSGDPPGTGSRKPAFHFRRGSSGTSSSSSATGGSGGNPAEENLNQAGSSSPALHHQAQSVGAQVKKKSGFQITSVTSAQISGNNSLADDTESYDDMDESHTEDLSSSDMLDVSTSKATDTSVPERSSSDETLNSLHGVDTPGIVSPNEPLQPHGVLQASHHHPSLVNGSMHHQYYPQNHSQPHHHHSDSLGGGEPATLPVASVATSSPAMSTKAGSSHRTAVLDNPKPVVAAGPQVAPSDGHSSAKMATVPSGCDGASAGGGSTQTQHTHSQTATGSRFRVVKLDTSSEPFRKGRWTCTEYYEKEVPHPAPSEAPRAPDVIAEAEVGNAGFSPGVPAVQPPHSLQPYQPPSQDLTSPQTMPSPPQALTAPLSYVSPQEVAGMAHIQKPVAVGQPPPVVPQGGYPAPKLHTGGILAPGSVRQPDFIQPTAPFQTQVPPPLPLVATGISSAVPGVPASQSISITQQVPSHQGPLIPPPTLPVQPQLHTQHPTAPVPVATIPGIPYKPLTTLQADLQPLLTLGTNFTHAPGGGSSIKSSQLEDAQKLLIQHQGLLGLPRLGASAAVGGEGAIGHMGMSAEASAFMVAAGLRSQHAEGEDSSSGASVVAIDNKIEQAMDLVKSHLMYAVREEVEVLKEQIKELMERNTQLEQENNLLKTLASPEQMAQFQAQVQTGSPTSTALPPLSSGTTQVLASTQNSSTSA